MLTVFLRRGRVVFKGGVFVVLEKARQAFAGQVMQEGADTVAGSVAAAIFFLGGFVRDLRDTATRIHGHDKGGRGQVSRESETTHASPGRQ